MVTQRGTHKHQSISHFPSLSQCQPRSCFTYNRSSWEFEGGRGGQWPQQWQPVRNTTRHVVWGHGNTWDAERAPCCHLAITRRGEYLQYNTIQLWSHHSLEVRNLLRQKVNVGSSSKRHDLEILRFLLAYIQCLGPDGALHMFKKRTEVSRAIN